MARTLCWIAIAVLVYYLMAYEILPRLDVGHD